MHYLESLLRDNFCNLDGLLEMCIRFLFNLAIVWAIVHFFYYPKGRRRDYYFTFILLSISIFMLIYLMDGSNLQIGAALGLFAVFGIIRYRTESVPIREMTTSSSSLPFLCSTARRPTSAWWNALRPTSCC